jgi:hypothetical protein
MGAKRWSDAQQRSDSLTKFDHNPLWLNPAGLWCCRAAISAPTHAVFCDSRDYDTPSSRIVLASSEDGIKLTELKNLVAPVANQRNQSQPVPRSVTKRYFPDVLSR